MAERYWITGVQLGMLKVLVDKDHLETHKILKAIEDDQFLGNVSTELSEHDQETADREACALIFSALRGREPTEREFEEMMK